MSTFSHLPASDQRLDVYKKAQSNDLTCQQILKHCQKGWRNRSQLNSTLKLYGHAQAELTEGDKTTDVWSERIVVLKSLQAETLQKLHEGHQGIIRYLSEPKYPCGGLAYHNTSKATWRNAQSVPKMPNSPRAPHSYPLPAYCWQSCSRSLPPKMEMNTS